MSYPDLLVKYQRELEKRQQMQPQIPIKHPTQKPSQILQNNLKKNLHELYGTLRTLENTLLA